MNRLKKTAGERKAEINESQLNEMTQLLDTAVGNGRMSYERSAAYRQFEELINQLKSCQKK